MKKWRRFGFLLALGFIFCKPMWASDEITLFDRKGEPGAYIAGDLTVYLWDGKPVAYLYESDGAVHLYNFEGDHLGWFEEGILWDHSGAAVGFRAGAVNIVTYIESTKSVKGLTPIKGARSVAPIKPLLHDSWSSVPLSFFLRTVQASQP
ncbi:MAG: hypothetical protein DMG12_01195 [Acidobacteria bacterium]|nr:MAG: hypothetical protein DMG12_01195 [Acidobacteriota bacterium]